MGYVWRHLFERKVRTLLSLVGVGVSVAGIVALLSVTYGMRRSLNTYMEESGASLVVFSRAAADLAFSRVDAADVHQIGQLPQVAATARSTFTAVMSARLGPERRREGVVFVFGRYWHERLVQKYRSSLVAGRLPERKSEILAGEYFADQAKIRLGDRFPLFDREYQGVKEYEVVGIYRTDISWENLGLVVHADVVQEQLNAGDRCSILFVYTDPARVAEVRAEIERRFPHLVAMPSGEFTTRFGEQTQTVDDFVLILTSISVALGILGVLNTMMTSVHERVREIGTLRALGWSRARVVRLILQEGLLLSSAGGVIGLALGYGGTEILIRWFHGGLLQASYLPSTFLKAMVTALVVGLLGALYPAVKASSLRPVEALRYE